MSCLHSPTSCACASICGTRWRTRRRIRNTGSLSGGRGGGILILSFRVQSTWTWKSCRVIMNLILATTGFGVLSVRSQKLGSFLGPWSIPLHVLPFTRAVASS
ncbi:hypothetical protein BDV98DRAFT_562186 [Pterulicium gracile]|uniref:Uncharacterized protein n=1 Tax=Pterulicium gracile TaxID=1884261 RepID=A0A5C3QS72_9AGAR|nr:hypothetical protein BDV98DRAFT_562186 [Pterula gracilis]